MNIEPIGFVKSEIIYPYDQAWGEVISEIIVNEEYAKGIIGLEDFSHAIIIFYMHKASYVEEKHLVRHPREQQDLPKIGIFAQRARHRPNPIGITTVRIISVEGNTLTVKGLDAINETPVLDIKPYYPIFDKRDDASTPDWVQEIMKNYF
ncbi:MAG: tRNA (N6-threonylcarbamoyladenosine(37)-N6)-methyltransferase TrmO [Candidatus Heimdallarchaeota archaeon]|nr:tRNA (N6-threonylcarbamoyladenosine(37)-N6)-methyltransferase TrmO [Candidatus Heimdallarchaeota archaeon]MBY8993514.1 tRNA (N6-threonylcarbamoyladenosine(37)-N6)-methyltransferase TrmO [Candidatus Heimdallarchaeota archaeon]